MHHEKGGNQDWTHLMLVKVGRERCGRCGADLGGYSAAKDCPECAYPLDRRRILVRQLGALLLVVAGRHLRDVPRPEAVAHRLRGPSVTGP